MPEPTPIAAGLGHNQPPSDIELLVQRLSEETADLLKRQAQLEDALSRTPARVQDEDQAGRMAEYLKQLTAFLHSAEERRKAAKEPYLEASRAVDGFFRRMTDAIASAKTKVALRLSVYQEEKAKAVQAIAPDVGTHEAGRVRSELGVTAALRQSWDFEIVDERKVPKKYLSVDTAKVRAAIKAGEREIPGLRVYQRTTTIVR